MKITRIRNNVRYVRLKDITAPKDLIRTTEWRILSYHIRKSLPYCMNCGATWPLEIDHIKPLSKYPRLGLNWDNIQVLCKNCNSKKSNKIIIDCRDTAERLKIMKIFKDRSVPTKLEPRYLRKITVNKSSPKVYRWDRMRTS